MFRHRGAFLKEFNNEGIQAQQINLGTRGADKSLAQPTSRCIVLDGQNISFDASLVIYVYIVLIFLQLWL